MIFYILVGIYTKLQQELKAGRSQKKEKEEEKKFFFFSLKETKHPKLKVSALRFRFICEEVGFLNIKLRSDCTHLFKRRAGFKYNSMPTLHL